MIHDQLCKNWTTNIKLILLSFPKVITFLDVFNNVAEFAEVWLNISDAIKEEIREVITNRTADDSGYDSEVRLYVIGECKLRKTITIDLIINSVGDS